MWFKNITLYRLDEDFAYPADHLADELVNKAFHPCGNLQAASMGWTPPLDTGDDSPLVHAANGFLMICLKIEEKVLPPRVINEELQLQIDELEAKEDRKVYRKEKARMKDELIYTLLPRAFSQSQKIYAYIDTKDNLLLIDASSPAKAELLCAQLRKTLGSLKISPLELADPDAILTAWLQDNQSPDHIHFTDYCVMQHPQHTRSIIRCKGEDVFNSNIETFIDDGFCVTEMGLAWHNQMVFVLKDDFSFKRLQFTDIVKEQVNEAVTETEAERFDADFAILTSSVQTMLRDFIPLFEGKAVSEKPVVPELVEMA